MRRCCFYEIRTWVVKTFSSIQLFSHVQLFATPYTAAHQAFLSITNTWSLLNLMSIQLLKPSNHLMLYCPLLPLPSIFPSIRAFSRVSSSYQEATEWNFSFSISPSNEYSGWFSLGWTSLISLQYRGLSRSFSNTTVQKHQFFGAQLSL